MCTVITHAGSTVHSTQHCYMTAWTQIMSPVMTCSRALLINVKWLKTDQCSCAADELRSIHERVSFLYGQWFWFSRSACWLSYQTLWQRLNGTIMKVSVCFHTSGGAGQSNNTVLIVHFIVFASLESDRRWFHMFTLYLKWFEQDGL